MREKKKKSSKKPTSVERSRSKFRNSQSFKRPCYLIPCLFLFLNRRKPGQGDWVACPTDTAM